MSGLSYRRKCFDFLLVEKNLREFHGLPAEKQADSLHSFIQLKMMEITIEYLPHLNGQSQ